MSDVGKSIKVKDMTTFKWIMLNITGHDFMHDFMLNTERTEKGAHGGKSILDYLNKTVRSTTKLFAKGKKNKKFITNLIKGKKGGQSIMHGGMKIGDKVKRKVLAESKMANNIYKIKNINGNIVHIIDIDNLSEFQIDINSIESVQEISSIIEYKPYELSHFKTKLDHLNYLNEFQCTDEGWVKEQEGENIIITHNHMSEIIDDYFDLSKLDISIGDDDNYTLNGYVVPRVLKDLAQTSISSVLSPVIANTLNFSSSIAMADNKLFSGVTISEDINKEGENVGTIREDGGASKESIEKIEETAEAKRLIEMKHALDTPITTFNAIELILDSAEYGDADDDSRNVKKSTADLFQKLSTILINQTNNSLYKIINGKEEISGEKEKVKIFGEKEGIEEQKIQVKKFAISNSSEETLLTTELNNLNDKISGEYNESAITTTNIDRSLNENNSGIISQQDYENRVIFGKYDKGSLLDTAKTILKSNLAYNNKGHKEFRVFLEPDNVESSGEITFDNDVIEASINMMYTNLVNKYIKGGDFWSQDDLNFTEILSKGKDKFLEIFINIVENFKQYRIPLSQQIIDEITTLINNNRHKQAKFIILKSIHPDRSPSPELTKFYTIQTIYLLSEYAKINFSLKGGHLNQYGGGKDDKKLFKASNTLLCKAILENSLTILECVTGDKNLGYFPDTTNKMAMATKTLSSYKGLKPIFFDIFSGIDPTTLPTNSFSKTGNKIIINWNEIKNGDAELKNLLARRILLNVQILILFSKCTPSHIRTNNLLEGLKLKQDSISRKYTDCLKRGYRGGTGKGTDEPKISAIFGTIDDLKIKIHNRRTKFFGFLFDNYKHNDIPNWFKSTQSADDMLQDSFNIVLTELLSQNIFMMSANAGLNAIPKKANLPDTETITPSISGNKAGDIGAYIINNAVPMIHPVDKKMNDPRFGFLNLNGEKSKKAQFCPVTSIADSQPLCSIVTKKSFDGTQSRAVNYSMDMGLEVDTYKKNGEKDATWSYYVNLEKTTNEKKNYDFYISGTLSLPTNSFTVGDKINKHDLRDGPLSAVTTFYEILYSINIITKNAFKRTALKGSLRPRTIVRNFFKENMNELLKCSIKKSIGDYGQEFTAAAKNGTLSTPEKYNEVNRNQNNNIVSIPYNKQGNALRIMVANDRPSAYRGISLLLFTQPDTINSRSIMGYFKENFETALVRKKKTSKYPLPKNTLVFAHNVISNTGEVNFDSSIDDIIIQIDPVSANFQPKIVGDKHYNRDKSIARNRKNRRSKRLAIKQDNNLKWTRRIGANRKFAKWVKETGKTLKSTKTRAGKKHNKTLFNEWRTTVLGLPELRGGNKKSKRFSRKKQRKKKNKTKRRREKKQKTKKRKKCKKLTKKNLKRGKHIRVIKGGFFKQLTDKIINLWENPHRTTTPNDCCPCVFSLLGMPRKTVEYLRERNINGFSKDEIERGFKRGYPKFDFKFQKSVNLMEYGSFREYILNLFQTIPVNYATLGGYERNDGTKHCIVFAKNTSNIPIIFDAQNSRVYIGIEQITAYLLSQRVLFIYHLMSQKKGQVTKQPLIFNSAGRIVMSVNEEKSTVDDLSRQLTSLSLGDHSAGESKDGGPTPMEIDE